MRHPTHGGRAVAAEPAGEARTTAPAPRHTLKRPRDRTGLTTRGRTHAQRAPRRAGLAALLVALALGLTACGDGSVQSGGEGSARITVFASAVLTEAFTELGEMFAAEHPDVAVAFNFAGAGELVSQLEQGASADVLAVADAAFMEEAAGLVNASTLFARNKLAVAVAPGNPKGIRDLSGLARPDVVVVLGSEETSVGRQSQEALSRAGVQTRPSSLELSVKGVVTKVTLGEADAGIVFASDVVAADGSIDGVAIPDEQNVVAAYPIATLAESAHGDEAQAFVDLVLSARGQKVLADHGFLAAP